MQPSRRTLVFAVAMACLSGCGTPADQTATDKPPAAGAAPAKPAHKNACALVDREAVEAIVQQKLEMLNNIEEDNKTTCELHPPRDANTLVYVSVYWTGGKEMARVNQAAMSMAKGLMNDDDTDIEALTGSKTVPGLADKAFYSDVMPSWILKGDVYIEITSPTLGSERTKAVFLSVAKTALTRLGGG